MGMGRNGLLSAVMWVVRVVCGESCVEYRAWGPCLSRVRVGL